MLLHGLRRDVEARADLLLGQPVEHQRAHLTFPLGQQPRRAGPARSRAQAAPRAQQPPGGGRVAGALRGRSAQGRGLVAQSVVGQAGRRGVHRLRAHAAGEHRGPGEGRLGPAAQPRVLCGERGEPGRGVGGCVGVAGDDGPFELPPQVDGHAPPGRARAAQRGAHRVDQEVAVGRGHLLGDHGQLAPHVEQQQLDVGSGDDGGDPRPRGRGGGGVAAAAGQPDGHGRTEQGVAAQQRGAGHGGERLAGGTEVARAQVEPRAEQPRASGRLAGDRTQQCPGHLEVAAGGGEDDGQLVEALGRHRVGCHACRCQAGEVPRRLVQRAAHRLDHGARPAEQDGQPTGCRVRQLVAGRRQVAHRGGDITGERRGQRRPAGRAGGGRAVERAPDPAPAGGGVEQGPVSRGPRRGHPGRPPVRVGAGGERVVGRIDGPEHVAVAPGLLGPHRVGLDPHDLRDHDRACAFIGIPLRCLSTMLAGVGGSEYVSVHARTGYLATQVGQGPYARPARMPSQLRTTARQASVVARPSIGLTVWRCQRSSAA